MVAAVQKRNPVVMTMSQLASDLGPLVKLNLNKAFGFKYVFPEEYTVDGFANPSLFTPRKIPGFQHDPDFVTFMLLARKAKFSAYVHGMHGGGKTENVLQFCSVLNLPVQVVQCHRDITVDDLVGMMLPRPDGSCAWVDGPLTIAARHGHVCFINERPKMKPGVEAFLHNVLEGRPLVLNANNGEVVPLHPDFWIVADGNDGVGAESEGDYQHQYQTDKATTSRYVYYKWHYREAGKEEATLKEAFPDIAKDTPEIISMVVQLANKSRDLKSGAKAENCLTVRDMIQWLKFMEWAGSFGVKEDPVTYGFRHAYFIGQSYDDRVTLADQYKLICKRDIDAGDRPKTDGNGGV